MQRPYTVADLPALDALGGYEYFVYPYTYISKYTEVAFFSSKIIFTSSNKEVEKVFQSKVLYAWGKNGNIISDPVSASCSIVHTRDFNDIFTSINIEKWRIYNLETISISNNKIKITNVDSLNEYNMISNIKFTNDFNGQIKIESVSGTDKAGVTLSSKSICLNNPLYNSSTVSGEPIIGAYVSGGNLVCGVLNSNPNIISVTLPIWIKIAGIYSSKAIVIWTSTDNINWVQQYSGINPKVNNVSIQWPLCVTLSNVSTTQGAFVEFFDFKINSGNYEYI